MAVLYVTEQGSSICKSSERIIVKKEGMEVFSLPSFKVSQVVILGNVNIKTPAFRFFMKNGIDIVFLDTGGRFQGRSQPLYSGNSILRKCQVKMAENPFFTLQLAKTIVMGKAKNMRTILMRLARENERLDLSREIEDIRYYTKKMEFAQNLQKLRGFEGVATATYFAGFRKALFRFKPEQPFMRRQKRPPKDPVNSLLGLGYSLLLGQITGAIYSAGLDPYQGFYHCLKFGRPALALDMMEEFRAPVVDATVLALVNLKEIVPQDFIFDEENEKCVLDKDALKKYFHGYTRKISTIVTHDQLGIKGDYLRIFNEQARELSRCIKSGVPDYRAFLLK